LWIGLSCVWTEWRSVWVIVQPHTGIAWPRKAFRMFWTWKVRRGQPGPPVVSPEVRALIHRIRRECLDYLVVFNQRSLKRYLQADCA
jgi:hypothetical protein